MSDDTANWWDYANRGIIGLPPAPFDKNGWPTEGYDGPLTDWSPYEEGRSALVESGRSREEWLALGAEMIARWMAWRDYVKDLPD